VQPILQQLSQTVDQRFEQFSQRQAVKEYGHEAVAAAEQWLRSRVGTDPTVVADYQRIMSSGHPYAELVETYKASQALKEIGNDPAAYRERLRAEILEEIRSSGGHPPAAPQLQAAAPPAVMPTNFADVRNSGGRTGSVWQGPTPLKDIFKPSG
jgi:hypothetical protein